MGKIPPHLLNRLLGKLGQTEGRVILGPGIGVDATVLDTGSGLIAVKVDPITFATDEIGWYAVHVNANDIAVVGGSPAWFLATVLLPENRTTPDLPESIFEQISRGCREVGAALVGGHTEITYGLDRPVVAGCMLGPVARNRLVHPRLIEPGDEVVLARGIAIEATSIIAREFASEVEDRFGPAFTHRCRRFLYEPGISVVRAAAIALGTGWVHAMHDPTEGGLITGLWEMAEASGLGLEVHLDRVHIYPETAALCSHFGLDPLGIIASGSLLLAVRAGYGPALTQVLTQAGIPAATIGRFVEDGSRLAQQKGKTLEVIPRNRDEIATLFERRSNGQEKTP